MSEKVYVYTATKSCGCVTGVMVDRPENKKDVSKEVASYIRSGRAVKRITLAAFHKGKFGECDCTPDTADAERSE